MRQKRAERVICVAVSGPVIRKNGNRIHRLGGGSRNGNEGLIRQDAPAEQRVVVNVAAALGGKQALKAGIGYLGQKLGGKNSTDTGERFDRCTHETDSARKLGF